MNDLRLEVPAWLVELAAKDEPPTTISDELLKRLQRAGVQELAPTDGAERLSLDELARLTAIGAYGPGFGFAESFEDESAPVAGALERLCTFLETFDRLRRLKLAGIDMRHAEAAARQLRAETSIAGPLRRVLETGLVVTYCRPYLDSNKSGGVGGRGRWQPESKEDRALHRHLIDEMRDPYHAHADRTPRRTLIDTAELLGLKGPPTFSEAWWFLPADELDAIIALAAKQAERFEAAARELEAELAAENWPGRGAD